MCTIGEFLQQKAGNMTLWLKEAGNPTELDLGKLTPLQITYLAQTLHDKHSESIEVRDFAKLVDSNMPPELRASVNFVRERPALHDKFWRYLALFSDTVEVSNNE